MKKKIFSLSLLFLVLVTCMFLFTACGNLKSVKNKTLVFAKVEVTGTLIKEDYESQYQSSTFVFEESTVTYTIGSNKNNFDYKVEKGKVYLKYSGDEFSEIPFAELSGAYMVVTETYAEGTVKTYFKVK